VISKNLKFDSATYAKNQGLVNFNKPASEKAWGTNELSAAFTLKQKSELNISFDSRLLLYVFIADGVVKPEATAKYNMKLKFLRTRTRSSVGSPMGSPAPKAARSKAAPRRTTLSR
jgi:hypothetical protein